MPRTKEAFEYGQEAEDHVEKYVNSQPQTTNAIAIKVRKEVFSDIHRKTVERLLENLRDQGKIQGFTAGRVKLWQKLER